MVSMLGVALFAVLRPASAGVSQKRVDFARDVLPILSENCFLCHGPDSSSRQAGLRLDTFVGATADRGGRFAIVPGKPADSLMVQRINSESAPMPPVSSHKTLTALQREVLSDWILQGAEYSVHWAFVPLPAVVPVPRVDSPWMRDELDAFVIDRLRAEGLEPSREATRERWLRRVFLDLTGLPPTVTDMSSFKSGGDHSSVVDGLLASPRFGERMAVWWLDAARYADSYGYQSDLIAPVWPYRDWVVRAFNSGMRYDQFLTEQVAGDLLPEATRDQVLATAFNRLHRMTNEGGSIAEEWKTEYAMDRAETFGTAFLGLTVGCARCHDHKYDPLTQKEYYQLFAYFNSIDEFGMLLSSEIVPTPSLLLPTDAQEKRLGELVANVEKAREEVAMAKFGAVGRFMEWLRTRPVPVVAPVVKIDFDAKEGNRFVNAVNGKVVADALQGAKVVTSRNGQGLGLSGDDGLAVRGLGSRERWDAFSWSFWMKAPMVEAPSVVLHRTGGTDVGFCGFDMVLERGRLTARVMRHWPGNAVAIRTLDPVSFDDWTHVGWSWDGSGTASGLRLYVNGLPVKTELQHDSLWKTINAYGDLGIGGGDWTFGARFRDLGLRGGAIDDVIYFDRSISGIEMRLAAVPNASYIDRDLMEYFEVSVDADCVAAQKELRRAQEELARFENGVFEIAVMRESARRVPAYLLARGQYDSPRTEENRVERGVPSFLLPTAAEDRLGLAKWATQKDHPLTARVFVNRVWQMLFGRGLVETSENLGVLGSQPSHPELLDYLSRWFVSSGWDVKGLLRKIVLSATYRQDSALSPALAERDPENVLLARGPSQRLDAEMLRDTVLAASGLLDARLGGPPVNPYQPSEIWTENNSMTPRFVQSVGSDLYRRSLYTLLKRTTPAPDMVAFDASGREACVMRRTRTGTPMQALVTLNHVQYVEAARVLAERMVAKPEGRRGQVAEAFGRLAARQPTEAELAVLLQCFEEQFDFYRAHLAEAIELCEVGDMRRKDGLRASEVAAMTVTVQTIMNSDAVVWKR
jgi:hypothetical protein